MSLINWGIECKPELTAIANHGAGIYESVQSMAEKFPVGDVSILSEGEREAAVKDQFFAAFEETADAQAIGDGTLIRKFLELAWPVVWEVIRKRIGL